MMKDILDIVKEINVSPEYAISYGRDKAKNDLRIRDDIKNNPDGN